MYVCLCECVRTSATNGSSQLNPCFSRYPPSARSRFSLVRCVRSLGHSFSFSLLPSPPLSLFLSLSICRPSLPLFLSHEDSLYTYIVATLRDRSRGGRTSRALSQGRNNLERMTDNKGRLYLLALAPAMIMRRYTSPVWTTG